HNELASVKVDELRSKAGLPGNLSHRSGTVLPMNEAQHFKNRFLMLAFMLERELPGVPVDQQGVIGGEVRFVEGVQGGNARARQVRECGIPVGNVDAVILRVIGSVCVKE